MIWFLILVYCVAVWLLVGWAAREIAGLIVGWSG